MDAVSAVAYLFAINFAGNALSISLIALVVQLFRRGRPFPTKTVLGIAAFLAVVTTIGSAPDEIGQRRVAGESAILLAALNDLQTGALPVADVDERVALAQLAAWPPELRQFTFRSLAARAIRYEDVFQSFLQERVVKTPLDAFGEEVVEAIRRGDAKWDPLLTAAASRVEPASPDTPRTEDTATSLFWVNQWAHASLARSIERTHGFQLPMSAPQLSLPHAYLWLTPLAELADEPYVDPRWPAMITAIDRIVAGDIPLGRIEGVVNVYGPAARSYLQHAFASAVVEATAAWAVGDAVERGVDVDVAALAAFARYLGLRALTSDDVALARATRTYPPFLLGEGVRIDPATNRLLRSRLDDLVQAIDASEVAIFDAPIDWEAALRSGEALPRAFPAIR